MSSGINIPVEAYDAGKQRRRITILRSWNRLSRLQRYLLTCVCSLSVIFLLIKLQPTASEPENPAEELHARQKPALAPPLKHRSPNDEIILGEEKARQSGEVERILGPENNRDPDDENGNDSVVGGAGEDVDAENKIPVLKKPRLKSKSDEFKEKAVEEIQEGMVMPRPKIFAGSDNDKQGKVREAFLFAWDAYKRHAWGHDELKPISRSYKEWFKVGLTLIDSLDTMYIMGLTKEFDEAKKWVTEQLTFDKDVDVNLFEITIRVVGGLLSAYHLSGEDIFKEKALDLGKRLTAAFVPDSGVPYSDVNLKQAKAHAPKWGPDSSSAEVTTIQLEFRDLTYVSNDPKFEELAFKVSEHFHKLEKKDGLIPIFINAVTGEFRPASTITFGARGDSYYEYLLKQWIQDGKRTDWLRADFLEAMNGAQKHLIKQSKPNNLSFVGELIMDKFYPKMDALACFLPGTLVLAYMNGLPVELLTVAEQLLVTCHEMYSRSPTGLAPEITHFNYGDGKEVPEGTDDMYVRDNDAHALLRPEFVESLFYMYRLTKNTTYQEWGWDVFQAIEKYAKVPGGGYASVNDVREKNHVKKRDHMESFLLGETFKYLYLLLGTDQTVLSLDEYVFNSEAHPLPIRKG